MIGNTWRGGNHRHPRLQRQDQLRQVLRRQKVGQLSGHGLSMRRIASMLGVNVSTVSRDLRAIFDALNARERALYRERSRIHEELKDLLKELWKIELELRIPPVCLLRGRRRPSPVLDALEAVFGSNH
jgi:hypothetical protein